VYSCWKSMNKISFGFFFFKTLRKLEAAFSFKSLKTQSCPLQWTYTCLQKFLLRFLQILYFRLHFNCLLVTLTCLCFSPLPPHPKLLTNILHIAQIFQLLPLTCKQICAENTLFVKHYSKRLYIQGDNKISAIMVYK